MEADLFQEIYNDFAAHLCLRQHLRSDSRNFIVSPFSIMALLSTVAEFVPAEARDEFSHLINERLSHAQLRQSLLTMVQSVSRNPALRISGSVYRPGLSIKELASRFSFSRLPETEIPEKYLSFSYTDQALREWLGFYSKEMLTASDMQFYERALLSLISAISFDGRWAEEYGSEDIEHKVLTGSDGRLKHLTTFQGIEHYYIEDAFVKGFVKPFKRTGCSLMVLLAKESSMEFRVRTLKQISFSKLMRNRRYDTIRASVPEFSCTFCDDLTDYPGFSEITRMSLKAHGKPAADLLFGNHKRLFQKSMIRISRNGASAASLTDISEYAEMPKDPAQRSYELENPFLFAIMHNRTMLPLFVGCLDRTDDPA